MGRRKMDINVSNKLQVLVKGFLILFLLACPAAATVTIEAMTADGVRLYSGDSINTNTLLGIQFTSDSNLAADDSALTLRIDSADHAVTPSQRTPGTITGSYNASSLADGDHILRITVKELSGNTTTWEATHISVNSADRVDVLAQPLNFPNPCGPADTKTYIGYKLSKDANITLSIHDMMGNLISRQSFSAGTNGGRATYNEVEWNLKTDGGSAVGNGIYVYLIIGDGRILSKGRIAIVK